jgi:maleylacetoacetate isomerase
MALTFYEAVLSSAAFRVRIALAWKGLAYESRVFDLRAKEQHAGEYRKVNPMLSVPALSDGANALFESMAICEYLEETHPEPPLLPRSPIDRARVRAMAQVVACDIHPLNNLRVLRYLSHELKADEPARDKWAHHWISDGFNGIESLIPEGGDYCFGNSPTLADIFLIPQVANAHRVKLDLKPWPRIQSVYDACMKLPAFEKSHPKNHPAAAK